MNPEYFTRDIVPADNDRITLGRSTRRFNELWGGDADFLRTLTVAGATSFSAGVTITSAGSLTVNGTATLTGVTIIDTLRIGVTNLAAATQVLTGAMSGQTFVGAVDAVFTLPAAATAGRGVFYSFVTGVASGGVGMRITANAADDIFAAGIDTAAGGSFTNSGATDVIGDSVILVSDGVSRWTGIASRGTWA